MSNLQPNCCLKVNSQKVDQHTGGEWLNHDTKCHKDNQLQSLKLWSFEFGVHFSSNIAEKPTEYFRDQRKRQSSASLAFVRGIHRWPVNSPHKWPVTRQMFPFDDVIMKDISFMLQFKLISQVTDPTNWDIYSMRSISPLMYHTL